ncbi:hypothetical protein BZA05DRAFT_447198 [Tricharina praecox]|uniref:uncharacterized protein n=1 Tax=Tricharina praecox TaxID=43433 RepID=UPI00221FF0DF|nr:uncharacterized protein BZA05DRAFT_447198 [Tricharina praecox]KAI5846915.1 hypothetical protein BZA05DRAFT_447198 [Tricharina praecox]
MARSHSSSPFAFLSLFHDEARLQSDSSTMRLEGFPRTEFNKWGVITTIVVLVLGYAVVNLNGLSKMGKW